jgi:hypothetical protein
MEHDDLIADMLDHGQVMADEQIGQAQLALQVLHEIEHLGLHRDIERTDRLVGHDQAGAGYQSAGNGDALALAAGELVRIFVGVLRAQTDLVKHAQHLLAPAGRLSFSSRSQAR